MILNRISKSKHFFLDKNLLAIVLIILIFGLIMLFSASGVVGFSRFGDSSFFIKRQLKSLFIGLILFCIAYKIDYHLWQKWSLFLLAGSLFLLVLVLIPGIGVSGQGAQRWLNFGFASFQPTEFAKLSLIIYISAWLSERKSDTIKDFKQGLVPFFILMSLFAFLILQQPDFGTLIIITIISGALFFVGGADIKHVLYLCVFGIISVWVIIKAAPYRLARFTAFLNPTSDPSGTGYHIIQALIAIGSGGIFGLGLGGSRQKYFFLPEVTGDSLFAIIAEELGFFASISIIILFLLFLIKGISISTKSPDNFGKLVAFGISIWIVSQAFMNIGAMLGILPLTGLPLPLMSYGGTSLMATLSALGILFNISKNNHKGFVKNS